MKQHLMAFCVVVALACLAPLFGQNASFQVALDMPQTGYHVDEIAVNEMGEAFAQFHGSLCDSCYQFFLAPVKQAGAFKGIRITYPPPYYYFIPKRAKTYFIGRRLFASYLYYPYGQVFSYDTQSKTYWSKIFNLLSQTGFINTILMKGLTAGENGGTIAVAVPVDDSIIWFKSSFYSFHLFSLDSLGNTVWKSNLKYSFQGLDTITPSSVEIERNRMDGSLFLTGKIFTDSARHNFKRIICKLSPTGSPLLWKAIKGHDFDQLFVRDEGVFLLGRTAQSLPFSKNTENAVLTKLDHDLNPVWTRAYSGESFEYARSTLNFLSDGSMVLGYSTTGAFPTVLAKLAPDGHILGQQGYPLFEPQLDVLSDGSLMMVANHHFGPGGGLSPKVVIARTDQTGAIDGCETFPACLTDGPVDIAFEPFDLEEYPDSTRTWDIPVSVDSLDFSFSDFCDIPAPPAPGFDLPGMVCANEHILAKATNNVLADAREWRVTGPGLDTTVRGSLDLAFTFPAAGQFKIAQKIWFLGCDYEHQRMVTVLPALGATIFPDTTRCETSPIELKVATNRPVSSLFWENGSPYPTILANLGEKHSVKVSDGICSASDSFLLEKFAPSPEFCHAKIYFPNVFSPNGDGLNDTFGPQGADFEAIKLTVFDRWGNIHFEGPGHWPGERAQPGVFTYLFEYRDRFSLKKGTVSGSVTVVK